MIKMAQNTTTKQQHLFELLKEDQEPFFLKDYIANRRIQMKNSNTTKTLDLHTKKRPTPKPLVSHKKVPCFCSSTSSPNVKKSPLFEFPSPITIKKSPTKSNPILLHIPARTAALLLEAASRIQNQSSKPKPKPKATKLGLLGSLLKRLSSHHRTSSNNNNNKKKERASLISSNPGGQSQTIVKDKFDGTSCNYSRPSSTSGVWSESNCEDKCLDSETSSSGTGQSGETSVDFVAKLMLMSHNNDLDHDHDQDFGFCDENEFCDQSPFRFVLQKSPSSSSSGRRTPDFSSPASSPVRRRGILQGKENYVAEHSNVLFQEEEEEEKEQFSPVSVLDPPFEDDYDIGHECEEEEDGDHQDAFDMESSYAIVQRTKQQLLRKLRRFERLAELDPIELEKRMSEEDNDDDEELDEELEEESEYCESNSPDTEEASDLNDFVLEILSESSYQNCRAPGDMKRLVSDLIVEEKREYQNHIDNREEEIVKGVVKRFESWKEVQSNTIDMMVEQDFRKELKGIWRNNNKEQIGETAIEIELEIFGLLVEELALELVALCEN